MRNFLAVVLGLLLSGSSIAAHGPAGCGLGSILFKDKSGTVFNVLAATFNGTSGNQTFGMSTGTLGCEDAKTSRVAAVSFIENNTVALSNDIAKGEGQALDAYLALGNFQGANKAQLKANFAIIFAEGNSATEIHKVISNIVRI